MIVISSTLPSVVMATDWVKLGSDREVEAYYDRESLRIVDYQFIRMNQYGIMVGHGPINKALVVTILFNYFSPTKCPEGECIGQPVNSLATDLGITCSNMNTTYTIRRMATSGKFNLGRTILDEVAFPSYSNYHGIRDERQLASSKPGPIFSKMLKEIRHLCESEGVSSGIDWTKVK